MLAEPHHEARWLRAEPRRTLPGPLLAKIVRIALPRCRIVNVQPFADCLRNANFKLQLDSTPDFVVLKIYEHDVSLCQKEVDLMKLIGGSVPVPELIYAEPRGLDEIPPFTLTRFVEGITFQELKRSGDAEAAAHASFSIGETLATLGRTAFAKPGWLGPGPTVKSQAIESEDAWPRFIDLCLASTNLQSRMRTQMRDQTHALAWAWAPRLEDLCNQTRFVHGDFGKRNLIVNSIGGKWAVVAVLDWELAVSGSPFTDLGHFLRYERASRPLAEPHFSNGYSHAGGNLPQDWRQLARLVDLIALCESLTHDHLPDDVASELVELVYATVEGRDPLLP